MNQIKRLTKQELINLGGSGNTKKDLINSVNEIYIKLKANSIDDLRTKSNQFIPRIKLITEGNKLKKDIKEKYNITYLKNTDLPALKARYRNDLANKNFDEIIRIAALNDGYLTYKVNGNSVIYHVNERNLLDLRRILAGEVEILEVGSDQEFFLELRDNIEDIMGFDINAVNNTFIEDEDIIRRQNETGGFLLYNHTLSQDFSDYGLFRKDQDVKEYHKNNCLYHAFKLANMSKDKLDTLKIDFFQRDLSVKNLSKVAEKLKIRIQLSRCYTDIKNHYGTEGEIYNIGIIKGHFFLIKPTEYTSYVIENYEEVKNVPNYMNIIGKTKNGYSRKNDRGINSKRLMEMVLDKYAVVINKLDVINTVYHHKIKSRVEDLLYLNTSIRLYETNEERDRRLLLNKDIKNKGTLRVFFDFETVASDINTSKRKDPDANEEFIHKPREITAIFNNTTKYWKGYKCGEEFIKYVLSIVGYKEIHLIAHNAGFDYNFIAAYLPNIEICKIGARFIYSYTKCKNSTIYVKDSYAFIAQPLRNFAEMFGLKDHKEEFNHDWIKYENLDENGHIINPWIEVKDTPKNVKLIDNKFNVEEYSKYYNEMDVKVLQQGYNIFGNWAKDLGVDIDKVYTVSSLAKVYAEKQGCYDGCYALSGIPQAFISQAVMGGRVMTQENKQIKLENVKVATLDANSLYPSAMVDIPGFIKGSPKVLNNDQLNIEFLNKQDYYFIDIKIVNVGTFLKMPLLAKREDFSINYTNDLKDQIMTVGKIYFEDLINFQKIEYEIIKGYYFNEGFNNKIGNVINHLYNERKRLKAEKNKSEAIYKLIMNSIYGKCLQKPRDKKLVVKNNTKDTIKYMVRNKTNIEMAEKISNCDKWLIREYKEINEDFNYVHIGCHILDASKRVMNEVITLAEENDINVYYTDTDSMHLNLENIPKLEKLYTTKYDKPLMNDELKGFKQDFGKDSEGKELYAENCIFLGKKTYIDCLNNGHNHLKAKGITKKAINYEAENRKITPWDIYNKRYLGEVQTFDLTCGGKEFTATQKNNFTFVSINNFTRTF